MSKSLKGVLLIVLPPVIFIAILTCFSISSFVVSAMADSQANNQLVANSAGLQQATPAMAAAGMIRFVLGAAGLITLIGAPISIIAGIVVLARNSGSAPMPK